MSFKKQELQDYKEQLNLGNEQDPDEGTESHPTPTPKMVPGSLVENMQLMAACGIPIRPLTLGMPAVPSWSR